MRFTYSKRKMAKLFAKSGDPDQTPHSAASDLGLHCLPVTLLRVSRLQWVKLQYFLQEKERIRVEFTHDELYKFYNQVSYIQDNLNISFFIPCHTIVAGYYGFTLVVCESVRPSVVRPSVCFSFPDDNLSKHQWIFTKLGMCIDIVEIWLGIANGQVSSIFDRVICLRHANIFVSR